MTLGNEIERSMQGRIQARLEELKQELETGQAELQKVEMQRTYLRETMLRIEGAMHALGELLAEKQQPGGQNGSASGENRVAATQDEEASV
jgi:hypothetical protein